MNSLYIPSLYQDGKLWYTMVRNNVDKPSVTNGFSIDFLITNGRVVHRKGLPACIGIYSGNENYYVWCKNGLKHRLDGPAILDNGSISYWLNGIQYLKDDWEKETIRYNARNDSKLNKILYPIHLKYIKYSKKFWYVWIGLVLLRSG